MCKDDLSPSIKDLRQFDTRKRPKCLSSGLSLLIPRLYSNHRACHFLVFHTLSRSISVHNRHNTVKGPSGQKETPIEYATRSLISVETVQISIAELFLHNKY